MGIPCDDMGIPFGDMGIVPAIQPYNRCQISGFKGDFYSIAGLPE